ncbi:MAG TPA: hypothetical protein VGF99_00075, partial [Myxococcota bacterium]
MTATTAPAPPATTKPAPPTAKKAGPQPSPTAKKLSGKTLKAKETRWDKYAAWFLAFVTAVIVVGLWAWSAFKLDAPPRGHGARGDTTVGYALGIITLVLYGVVAAYSLRHRRRLQKKAMTRTWMEVHLAFGLVAGLAAVLHSGPRLLSAAPLQAGFLVAWLLLIFTGFAGKIIGVVVPARLTKIEDEALLAEDVTEKQVAMRKEIEDLLQANPDAAFATWANTTVPRAIKDPLWYGRRHAKSPAETRRHSLRSVVIEELWEQTKGAAVVAADKHETARRVLTCLV